MTLVPAFEVAIWNAWILWLLQFVSMIIPDFFMNEEAKARMKRAPTLAPFNKTEKILALSTHMIIMPVSIIYSYILYFFATKARYPLVIYLSGFLLNLSIGIACASWVILLCAILWVVLWHIVVPTEERFLIEKYGNAYREYMNRTPRWIGIPTSH